MNKSPLLTGETLNDLNKTLGMLRRPFSGALDLVNRMVKSRNALTRKTAASARNATVNTWLEYRYGWKPLIMEAGTLAAECAASSVRGFQSRGVARSGESISKKLSVQAGASAPGFIYPVGFLATETCRSKINAGVIYSVANRNGAYLATKTLGLDARSLPATIWNTLPYSFVVDWVTNIGDWLEAVVPDPFVKVYGNWISRVEEIEMHYSNTIMDVSVNFPPEPLRRYTIMWPDSFVKTLRIQRLCNQPVDLSPRWTGKPLSALHSVDGVGLLLQRVTSGLKGLKH